MADTTISAGTLTYEVDATGYIIKLNGAKWIDQHEPYIPNPSISYEDNAKAQIKEIVDAEAAAKEKSEQNDRIESAVSTLVANIL